MSEPRLPLEGVDAIVLVGGRGTRLQGVLHDVPKPLAPVLGRPFLYYLLDLLALRGARSAVLACGYKAEAVRRAVPSRWMGMPVRFSVESEPLGTGGAAARALQLCETELVAVLNGDSWHDPDWIMLRTLIPKSGAAAALALAHVPDATRYGSVRMEGERIVEFREKIEGCGLVNAGAALFRRHALEFSGCFSLEREVLPRLAAEERLAGHASGRDFYDIGTPQALAAAGDYMERMGIAPHSMFPDFPDPTEAQVKLGACAVIRDGQGRVVLEKRSDCGWWCLPGGRVNPGETLAAAAVREAEEETGLRVEFAGFLGVFSDPARRIVRYPDKGDLRHLVDAVILARPVGGRLSASPESQAVAWFAPEDIPLCTVPPVVEILREASRFQGAAVLC